ncbi:putative reverse transcriptase domain-containing protein [Tanacetum coccineum]
MGETHHDSESHLDEPNTTSSIATTVPTNSGNIDGDPTKGTNVGSDDELFHVLNTPGNSSGGSTEVVKDGMDYGFVDPNVVKGVDEPASILDIHSRSGFSLYGYFVGKRVAFPVVENYIKNAWKKFGLVCVMMKSKGFFSFKFASIEGMNGVLENGQWFIRSAPIILKKWTPNVNLLKEDMNSFLFWVKFYDIPIVAFTADGLSAMDTKLGNLIMLNSYTSSICLQSWGRMDYDRVLIDFKGDRELKEDMIIVILNGKDDGEVMAISVISVSSDSSEDSVGTPAGRVILFGTIPTTIPDTTPVITPPTTQTDTTVIPTEIPIIAPTIPPSPDYTPASPDYSPASDMEFDPSEDPSSDHIPPLPAISPFLSSADDTTDSDTPDTPPSPTHGTPFTKTTLSTQRSPTASGALRRRVMVLAPGQPIPHGRPLLN